MKPFPPSSAARILTENIPTASSNDNVSSVIQNIRNKSFDSISYIYILNERKNLKGVLAIKSLLKAEETQIIREIMTKNPVYAHLYTDKEKVAIIAIQNNIKSVPVVDKNNIFQGVVTTDKILDILHNEHIEDILKLSGLDVKVLEKSKKGQLRTTTSLKMRLPWLIIGLLTGLISTWVISYFSDTIQHLIALAFFIPIITYMSGAIANQTLSMLIRNIIITRFNLKKYLFSEIITGTILGAIFGLALSSIAVIWFKSFQIGAIIFISLIVNSFLSVIISIFTPWFLVKYNKDPAYAAGPFSIVVQDLMSLIVYFTTASLILGLNFP